MAVMKVRPVGVIMSKGIMIMEMAVAIRFYLVFRMFMQMVHIRMVMSMGVRNGLMNMGMGMRLF